MSCLYNHHPLLSMPSSRQRKGEQGGGGYIILLIIILHAKETGSRAHSPKLPFYKIALLFPLKISNDFDYSGKQNSLMNLCLGFRAGAVGTLPFKLGDGPLSLTTVPHEF